MSYRRGSRVMVAGSISSSSLSSESPPGPGADHRLGAAARHLQVFLREPGAVRPRWRTHRFARRVDAVRAGLWPIASAEALEDSYRREAQRHAAVEAAYAVRWLELASGSLQPAWMSLVGG
jgi:hypothetical protein